METPKEFYDQFDVIIRVGTITMLNEISTILTAQKPDLKVLFVMESDLSINQWMNDNGIRDRSNHSG